MTSGASVSKVFSEVPSAARAGRAAEAPVGLSQQSEESGHDGNYAVDRAYDSPTGEAEAVGIDRVGVIEAMSALGKRVTDLDEVVGAHLGEVVGALPERD